MEIKDIAVQCYAAFIEKSVYHEGDQRSRDYPGHGYGAHTTTHTEVKVFKDEDELKDWIRQQQRYGETNYTVMQCTPVKIETQLVVKLS